MNSARPVADIPETFALPAHRPNPLFRLALSVLAAYGLLMLLIVVSTWALITQDWVRQQKVQETELTSLSYALSSKLGSTIASAEQTMHSIGHLALEHANASASEKLLDSVQRELSLQPSLGGVIVWRADGQQMLDTKLPNIFGTISVSPSIRYFEQHPQRESRVHAVVRGTDGRIYLPVEQVRRNALGMPRLYLYTWVQAQDILRFFNTIKLTRFDEACLLNDDAQLLLRINASLQPGTPPDFTRILAGETPPSSTPYTRGKLYTNEGTSYLSAFHWPGDHPLIIEISRPSHVASAGFLAMKQRLVVVMSALLLILALLAWLVYYDAKRHRNAREAMRKINTSLERRVHLRTSELEQTNRELLAFSYSVSHDLRAPLRAINGFAHALREDYGAQLDDRARDYMDRVCRASVRLGELIDELLSLSDLSRTPLDIREIDLAAMAREIVDELRFSDPDKPVLFQCEEMPLIEADEALMRNALGNLIGNAWKFTRNRSPALIRFAVEDDGDFRRYTLSDNGIGFDMAHAKRLFQPFQQLHGHQGFVGSGIGLASVRRIIERHEGQIWVQARQDEGAHFIFTLPVRPKVIRRQRPLRTSLASTGNPYQEH